MRLDRFRRRQTRAGLVVLAAALLGAGSSAAYLTPLASAQGNLLVRFVQAGPGPKQTTLKIETDGLSTETTGVLIPSTLPSRRFRLNDAMLVTLKTKLVAADFARLNARYGVPNPGGVFTVTTTGTRTATVYPPASGPAGLRILNLYLEQILTAH
jgi:hypothetical protein